MSSRALDALSAALSGRAPPGGVDWLALLDLANRALVTPRLALALEGQPGVPEDVARFLADVLARNRRRNADLTDQLAEAARALNGAGLRPVLLKGAAVLTLPPGPRRDGRMLCDLDLLVRPAQTGAAIAALRRAGYELIARARGPAPHVVAELCRPGDRATIDLHQRPPGPPAMAELADLEDRCQELVIAGGAMLVPDAAAQAYFVLLHDQLHDGDYWSGRLNLRHLIDMADLTTAPGFDWAALDRLVRTGVLRDALETQLVGAWWLTGAPIPEARRGRLWPRLQHRRRLEQVSHPWLIAPFTALTLLAEAPNLIAHRRENRAGRARLFGAQGAPEPASERWERLRDIFAAPVVGKL